VPKAGAAAAAVASVANVGGSTGASGGRFVDVPEPGAPVAVNSSLSSAAASAPAPVPTHSGMPHASLVHPPRAAVSAQTPSAGSSTGPANSLPRNNAAADCDEYLNSPQGHCSRVRDWIPLYFAFFSFVSTVCGVAWLRTCGCTIVYELFPSPFLVSKLIFLIPISETCSHLITTRVLRAHSDIRRRQRLAYPAVAIFRMLSVPTSNVISDTRRKSSIKNG
jgi:hypothetical protein